MHLDPYNTVREFEKAIAGYTGSPFAVAVDTCTAALFLCCRYLNVGEVTIPSRTYCSVPCSILHAGGRVRFSSRAWAGDYRLEPYPIIDSACRFRRRMYEPGTYRCLSFQTRKRLPIGRGGMILTDDAQAVEWFKLARFHGRHERPLMEDTPAIVGWPFYMEPERAARGLQLLSVLEDDSPADLEFNYPDLSTFALYGGS